MCPAHLKKERRWRQTGRGTIFFGLAVLTLFVLSIVWFKLPPEVIVIELAAIAIALLFVGGACILLQPRLFNAHYSDRRYLWVDGVSPEYLQQFPEIGGEG